jgi:hypothetical protein
MLNEVKHLAIAREILRCAQNDTKTVLSPFIPHPVTDSNACELKGT